METKKILVDRSNWKRNEIYEFFSNVSNPFYMASFNVDVTKLYLYTKENHLSFYYSMVYCINEALNQVENFRYSIENEEVYLLERREPSFTVLDKETELFKMITLEIKGGLNDFVHQATEKANEQKVLVDMENETSNLVYYTCLPWIELTALTNEMNYADPKMKDDCIPRIGWGKFIDENGKKKINLSVEVNHRFVDGLHIGKLAEAIESAINAL